MDPPPRPSSRAGGELFFDILHVAHRKPFGARFGGLLGGVFWLKSRLKLREDSTRALPDYFFRPPGPDLGRCWVNLGRKSGDRWANPCERPNLRQFWAHFGPIWGPCCAVKHAKSNRHFSNIKREPFNLRDPRTRSGRGRSALCRIKTWRIVF